METAVATYEDDEISISPGPAFSGIHRLNTDLSLRVGELSFEVFGCQGPTDGFRLQDVGGV